MSKMYEQNFSDHSNQLYQMNHGDMDQDSGMVPSLEMAAHDAAVADGLITGSQTKNAENKAKKAGLRRGKWTTEEELYANRLIQEFKSGLLPLTDGTTLRTFLSKLLNCDPMRISKKFVGQNCIGKQVFRRRQQDLDKLTADQVEKCRRELADLERKFLERVAQTNRTKTTGGSVKPLKDGKYDDGTGMVAPWMRQPDEFNEYNQNMDMQRGYAGGGSHTHFNNIMPTAYISSHQPSNTSNVSNISNSNSSDNYGMMTGYDNSRGSMINQRGHPSNAYVDPSSSQRVNISSRNQYNPTVPTSYDIIGTNHSNHMNRSSTRYLTGPDRDSYGNPYMKGPLKGPNSMQTQHQGNMMISQGIGIGIGQGNHMNDHDRGHIRNRVTSLDVLYSLDGLDLPSSASMDSINAYDTRNSNNLLHQQQQQQQQQHQQQQQQYPKQQHIDVNNLHPLPLAGQSDTGRETSDLNLQSFLGWPSMNSLLNSEEPSNISPDATKGRTGMMSALSSAVLQELQHLTSTSSISVNAGGSSGSSSGGLGGVSDSDSKSKRSLDTTDNNYSHENPQIKRQITKDSRYDSENPNNTNNMNNNNSSNIPDNIIVKKEKPLNEPYEDIGYSLEDDQAWSMPPASSHIAISTNRTEPIAAIPTLPNKRNGINAHDSSTRKYAASENLEKIRNPSMRVEPPLVPSSHTSAELIGAAVSSSFYQPIQGPPNQPIITRTASQVPTLAYSASNSASTSSKDSIHAAANSITSTPVATMAAAASSTAVATTVSTPLSSSSVATVVAAPIVVPGSSNKAVPRNSSVENFWMLVQMGDLPRPDTGVLTETVWNGQTGKQSSDSNTNHSNVNASNQPSQTKTEDHSNNVNSHSNHHNINNSGKDSKVYIASNLQIFSNSVSVGGYTDSLGHHNNTNSTNSTNNNNTVSSSMVVDHGT